MESGDLIQSRYRLNKLLGSGASGSVWSAKNELIDRDVALKIMRPDVAEDAVALQRFFNEAKASGRVRSTRASSRSSTSAQIPTAGGHASGGIVTAREGAEDQDKAARASRSHPPTPGPACRLRPGGPSRLKIDDGTSNIPA